jgi:hypothetical protein
MSSKSSRRRNEIADEIGDGLRAIYDGVLRERLPDRFSELLDQLDRGGNLAAHQKRSAIRAATINRIISRSIPGIMPRLLLRRAQNS